MIKNHGAKKLSKTGQHRRAMFANMLSSLIINERIITTLPKAKELQRFADIAISNAKNGRYSILKGMIRDKSAFKKIVEVITPRYKERNSGFTTLVRIAERRGDASLMAMVKLVD